MHARHLAPLAALCLLTSMTQALAAAPGRDAAKLFGDYCSVCHGDRGDGNSRAKGSMIPPPRDFTTPQAAMELTRERMVQAVRDGRPGTAMAGWHTQLSDAEIDAVVEYIRTTLMRPIASEDSEEARRLYAENCSVCHGDDGRGARWTLTNMSPPPRNFSLPAAKSLEREYMLQTVRYGKANTAMPGFSRQLNDAQIATVVDYVRKAFIKIDEPDTPGATDANPLAAAPVGYPGGLVGHVPSGQAFYLQNCAVCHGKLGDGKGPRAYFILPKPRDFQHPASRHGLDRQRLFTAISEGTVGTEMPAWDKVLTAQEIANVAEYVYVAFIRPDEQDNAQPGAN